MTDSQDLGGWDLEHYPYVREFLPPPPTFKHPYPSPTTGTTNGNGDSHYLTLKSSSEPVSTSFSDPDGLQHPDVRYTELTNWDLTYANEGLTVRVLDSRQLDGGDQVIQYRPWEKPDSSQSPTLTSTSTSNGSHNISTSNGTHTTTSTSTTTSNGKSPPKSLTTLTALSSSPSPNNNNSFPDSFSANGTKLPSFQSQFNSFPEPNIPITQSSSSSISSASSSSAAAAHHLQLQNGEYFGTLTNGSSNSSSSPALPSFHTLPANNYIHGHATLLSGPVQNNPHIQNLQAHERQIQLFPSHMGGLLPGQPTNGHNYVMTNVVTNGGGSGYNTGNGATMLDLVPVHMGHPGSAPSTSLHHALHPEKTLTTDGNIPGLISLNHETNNLNIPKYHHHHPHPNPNIMTSEGHFETLIAVKIPSSSHSFMPQQYAVVNKALEQPQQQSSPQIVTNSHHHPAHHGSTGVGVQGNSKRQPKRKRNSIDSVESCHSSSLNNDLNEPQVSSSVSSSESDFARNSGGQGPGLGNYNGNNNDPGLEKPVKKKRKRCGECIGCQRKDNCGECAPCRNEKSHQICKIRRCEKLTEKKVISNFYF
ncbi:unnamed protein product [Allacma fusca]|uniref:CXXC-type domain-containing protein n=1 Tax=Allacma fusca TaxID=39272 RepID=A0A8J2KXW8_9HEXA|nr:unnamed protein product [Allacma fusca]